MNNTLSFKSTIRPISAQEFSKKALTISPKNFVNSPWTINESVKAVSAVTKGVFDCSVLGITDGKKVFLMHICPTKPQNQDFEPIKEYIKENINTKDPNLQAVLLGSQIFCRKSQNLFENLKNLMAEIDIPCSTLRNCREYFDVLYDSIKDEWCISCEPIENCLREEKMSSEEIIKGSFYQVELSSFDEFA